MALGDNDASDAAKSCQVSEEQAADVGDGQLDPQDKAGTMAFRSAIMLSSRREHVKNKFFLEVIQFSQRLYNDQLLVIIVKHLRAIATTTSMPSLCCLVNFSPSTGGHKEGLTQLMPKPPQLSEEWLPLE